MSKKPDPGAGRYQRREDREKAHRDMLPGEEDTPLPPPPDPIKAHAAPKRNDPCPCGSGKKYKKCCGQESG